MDVTLTTEMLGNAYRDNFDIAILFSGDGDYVPLIREVQRYGKRVYLAAFDVGLNPALVRACDKRVAIEEGFIEGWRAQVTRDLQSADAS